MLQTKSVAEQMERIKRELLGGGTTK